MCKGYGTAVALVAIALLAICYLVVLSFMSWKQGYSWKEMDWQQRGTTSIADFLAASDIGKREIEVGGKMCVEYYSYKDGLPVKTLCQQ
jgi:hypothetical protein